MGGSIAFHGAFRDVWYTTIPVGNINAWGLYFQSCLLKKRSEINLEKQALKSVHLLVQARNDNTGG